jgi:hypothetical protein
LRAFIGALASIDQILLKQIIGKKKAFALSRGSLQSPGRRIPQAYWRQFNTHTLGAN